MELYKFRIINIIIYYYYYYKFSPDLTVK